MWGDRSYEHILHDIKDGTYQGLTMDVFEKKRLEWVKEIKNTEDPILRVEKALRYAREVEVWETKKHFLDLVAKDKTTIDMRGSVLQYDQERLFPDGNCGDCSSDHQSGYLRAFPYDKKTAGTDAERI